MPTTPTYLMVPIVSLRVLLDFATDQLGQLGASDDEPEVEAVYRLHKLIDEAS